MQTNKLPTGFLFSDEYSRGKLETLSIGDYGKHVNIKADFLGYSRELDGVPNAECMPLSEKWVITLSTQYGCPMKCTFCLPPEAKILMSDFSYKPVKEISLDDLVVSNVNPKENRKNSKQYTSSLTTVSKVTGLIERKYKGKMYTLTTETGESITCTDEHPVPVKRNSRTFYVDAKEVKVGDLTITSRDYSSLKENLDWATGWLLGFMDGDGVYDERDGKRCFVAQNDIELLEYAKEVAKKLGAKTTNIWKNGENSYRFGILGANLEKVLSTRDNISENFKKGYLAGYWDAEGFSLEHNNQYRVCDSELHNIERVSDLLKSLGYESSVSVTERSENFKNMYVLTAKLDKDTFIAEFKPLHKKKNYLESGKKSKTFCKHEEVVNITTEDYEGLVYNFETKEHNYYADNFLNHNCDVPNLQYRGNATFEDLKKQMYNAIGMFNDKVRYCERMNIHYARMGEPIFNNNVFSHAVWMYQNKNQIKKDTGVSIETLHPVLTTSLPKKFKNLEKNILRWCDIKNNVYNGQAGLQFSINSTSEKQRSDMYQGLQLPLEDFARIADKMPDPISRKYCLNFAYATDYEVDGDVIKNLFDPEKFMCKITPIHNNNACKQNGIKTVDGYESYKPYSLPEKSLKEAGFDVLVFVPSMDEEDGLVTCGNLILGGSTLKFSEDQIIKIQGL